MLYRADEIPVGTYEIKGRQSEKFLSHTGGGPVAEQLPVIWDIQHAHSEQEHSYTISVRGGTEKLIHRKSASGHGEVVLVRTLEEGDNELWFFFKLKDAKGVYYSISYDNGTYFLVETSENDQWKIELQHSMVKEPNIFRYWRLNLNKDDDDDHE